MLYYYCYKYTHTRPSTLKKRPLTTLLTASVPAPCAMVCNAPGSLKARPWTGSHWSWNHTITRLGLRDAAHLRPQPPVTHELKGSHANAETSGHYGQGRHGQSGGGVEWSREPGGAGKALGWPALSRPLQTRGAWALLYSEVKEDKLQPEGIIRPGQCWNKYVDLL